MSERDIILAARQAAREYAEAHHAQRCSCGHDHDPNVDFCIFCPCPDSNTD